MFTKIKEISKFKNKLFSFCFEQSLNTIQRFINWIQGYNKWSVSLIIIKHFFYWFQFLNSVWNKIVSGIVDYKQLTPCALICRINIAQTSCKKQNCMILLSLTIILKTVPNNKKKLRFKFCLYWTRSQNKCKR